MSTSTSPKTANPTALSAPDASIAAPSVSRTASKAAPAAAKKASKLPKAPEPKKVAAPAKAVKATKPVKAAKVEKVVKVDKLDKAVKEAKAEKAKKPKLVRDSFTIPKAEYELLAALKARSIRLKQPAKKSELLRSGIKLLVGLTDAAFLAALQATPALKTGRPKADPVK